MNKKIFREASLERVSSPESLNDYIRVSNPSVWLILIAVAVLLAGVFIWGATGKLETTLDAKLIVREGDAFCYLTPDQIKSLETGMPVRVADAEGTVAKIPAEPVSYADMEKTLSEYELRENQIVDGDWRYAVQVDITMPEYGGTADVRAMYDAQIITEQISPLSFIVN